MCVKRKYDEGHENGHVSFSSTSLITEQIYISRGYNKCLSLPSPWPELTLSIPVLNN